MKKRLCIFVLVCLICILGCSCKKEQVTYDVFVCGVDGSANGDTSIQTEIENWYVANHEDKTAAPTMSVSAFNMNMEGVYSSSMKKAGNPNKTAHYTQTNGNSFSVDCETGRLVGYNWDNGDRVCEVTLSMEQIENTAREMMETILNIDDYKCTVEWLTDWNMYHVQLFKEIDGIKTMDRADLYLLADGTPSMYSASSLGIIPADISLKVDYDAADESVKQKLNALYQDVREQDKYDDIEFSINERTITVLEDGTYAIIYSVDVCHISYSDETMPTEYGNVIGLSTVSHVDLMVPLS